MSTSSAEGYAYFNKNWRCYDVGDVVTNLGITHPFLPALLPRGFFARLSCVARSGQSVICSKDAEYYHSYTPTWNLIKVVFTGRRLGETG
jgi:hypothetical protein